MAYLYREYGTLVLVRIPLYIVSMSHSEGRHGHRDPHSSTTLNLPTLSNSPLKAHVTSRYGPWSILMKYHNDVILSREDRLKLLWRGEVTSQQRLHATVSTLGKK